MYTITTNKISWTTHQLSQFSLGIHHKKMAINITIQSIKKNYISRDVTFQENESYYKRRKNEISEQKPTPSFPQFYFPEEQRISNENEKEIPQEEESETPQTQEEKNEIQEDVGEEFEEIPLRRLTQLPQTSTRLHDFVTYNV
jgi:hypothetical protein